MVCLTRSLVLVLSFVVLLALSEAVAGDALQVARRIDSQVEEVLKTRKLAPVALAGDVEFMRRAYLDLTGRVPTVEQAKAFLEGQATTVDQRAVVERELRRTAWPRLARLDRAG